MKLTPRFKAIVDHSTLMFMDPDAYSSYLRILQGETVYISVEKLEEKEPRSNQQNRYYWGVVLKLLSDHLGYTPEEMHELMKLEFNSKKIFYGKMEQTIGLSTANLKTVEMEDYLSKIRMWASAKLSCYIPLPNEVNY